MLIFTDSSLELNVTLLTTFPSASYAVGTAVITISFSKTSGVTEALTSAMLFITLLAPYAVIVLGEVTAFISSPELSSL